MDPHIAALVGLDLNDPEDVAAIAKAEAEDAAIDRQNKLNADPETVEITYDRDVVPHAFNEDRTADNGWAYWRCTGCGELCHYAPKQPNPRGADYYNYCDCCSNTGCMPCLACGDPCLPAEHAEHIQTKHPACPVCLIIEGSALGTGCSCDKAGSPSR